jgi:D-lactate dehydrogenase
MVDRAALATMRRRVMIANTSRGALIDTEAVIDALKDGRVGSLAIDVYEEEADDVFARLLTFPNVLVTAHPAFFTEDALRLIAATTVDNISAFERHGRPVFEVG